MSRTSTGKSPLKLMLQPRAIMSPVYVSRPSIVYQNVMSHRRVLLLGNDQRLASGSVRLPCRLFELVGKNLELDRLASHRRQDFARNAS
jgi:hypothetical protein